MRLPPHTLARTLFFLSEWDEVGEIADQRVPVADVDGRLDWYGLLGMAAAKSGDRASALRYEERLITLATRIRFSMWWECVAGSDRSG